VDLITKSTIFAYPIPNRTVSLKGLRGSSQWQGLSGNKAFSHNQNIMILSAPTYCYALIAYPSPKQSDLPSSKSIDDRNVLS